MSNNAPDYENNLYFAPADEERDVKKYTFFTPWFVSNPSIPFVITCSVLSYTAPIL